jgi:hypothetical protein
MVSEANAVERPGAFLLFANASLCAIPPCSAHRSD